MSCLVDADRALDAGAGHDVVHAIERPQERRFPAARRTDQRGDLVGLDLQIDVLEDPVRPVVEIHAGHLDLRSDDRGRWLRGHRRSRHRRRERRRIGQQHSNHGTSHAFLPGFRLRKFHVTACRPLGPRHPRRRSGQRTSAGSAAFSAGSRNTPTCLRSSSWMRSIDRRASTFLKWNSSAIDAYSRSSLFW